MGWGWVCAGLLVALVVAWVVYRAAVYRRLFADEHFLEVARGLGRVKTSALDKLLGAEEDEVTSRTDPRVLLTSAGLALLYTVRQAEGGFVHHYSVSVAGGYTAHAVGETFVLFVAKLLGVPFGSLALGVGRSTVHHAEFRLSAAEQSEFAARPVPEVSPAEVTAFRQEWADAARHLRWQRLEAGPP
jgi:hypothetical protein